MAFPGRRKNGNPPPRHQDRESTPQTPAVGIHPPDPRHVVLWLVTLPTQGGYGLPRHAEEELKEMERHKEGCGAKLSGRRGTYRKPS